MSTFPCTILRHNWDVRGQSRPLASIASAIRTHAGLATWTARVNQATSQMQQSIERIEQGNLSTEAKIKRVKALKKQRDKLKSRLLPAATLAGEFEYRSNKGPYKLNGLYLLDLDGTDDPHAPPIAQRDLLHSPLSDYVALVYTSPSGLGLRVAMHGPRAETTAEYAETWAAMNALVELEMEWDRLYGIASDLQSKVAAMPYLLSHDITCYVNPQAAMLDPPPLPKPKPKREWKKRPQHRHVRGNGRTEIATAEQVHAALGPASKGPNSGGWYATTDEICHNGSSDNALSYRTDDEGMLQTYCFGSAACNQMHIRHALQAVTGLILCICPDCRHERRRG